MLTLFLPNLSPLFQKINRVTPTKVVMIGMLKDSKTVWHNCLKIIQESVSEKDFRTWFEPIVPLRLSSNILTIQVPTLYVHEHLENNFVYLLRKAIDAELGPEGRLEYQVVIDKGNEKNRPYVINIPTNKTPQNKDPRVDIHADKYRSPFDLHELEGNGYASYLNPIYNFDNFIEGDCNRLGRSAGMAVAQKPGITSFNPLLLYGGVGLGKTHLVQAIGNYIKQHDSSKFVLYVSCEKFTNQFIEAVRNNNMQGFMNFYLQVDVLVLDDVQFLSGKEKTQECFFHIFNHLHQAGKQVIMTTDRSPRELVGFEDRLLSRFKWGLSADLQQPDLETRIAIIQKKLQAEGIAMDIDVIEYIAHSIDTNVRELEGVIVSLMAQASLNRREIDLDLAKRTIQNIVQHVDKEISVEVIQKRVSEYFGVTVDDLKDKSRKKELVVPRQVAIYFTKEYTDFSLKSIGYHFGGRDHSTVIHAIQAVNDMLKTDKDFKAAVQEIQKSFKTRPNKH